MMEFIQEYWQWIIGVVLVPIVAALVKKTGRKQEVGDISGNRNTIINGDVK